MTEKLRRDFPHFGRRDLRERTPFWQIALAHLTVLTCVLGGSFGGWWLFGVHPFRLMFMLLGMVYFLSAAGIPPILNELMTLLMYRWRFWGGEGPGFVRTACVVIGVGLLLVGLFVPLPPFPSLSRP